jgi:hypothetical protein
MGVARAIVRNMQNVWSLMVMALAEQDFVLMVAKERQKM